MKDAGTASIFDFKSTYLIPFKIRKLSVVNTELHATSQNRHNIAADDLPSFETCVACYDDSISFKNIIMQSSRVPCLAYWKTCLIVLLIRNGHTPVQRRQRWQRRQRRGARIPAALACCQSESVPRRGPTSVAPRHSQINYSQNVISITNAHTSRYVFLNLLSNTTPDTKQYRIANRVCIFCVKGLELSL